MTDPAPYFTRSDGSYLFARWGRPLAPAVFGVEPESLPVLKGAFEAVAQFSGLGTVDVDPDLGGNVLLFFCRDWSELTEVPYLDRLVPEMAELTGRLAEVEANQYRIFRFDEAGAIRACFSFIRMDEHMTATPATTIALLQAVQIILLWSDTAFTDRPALILGEQGALVRPELGALIRAAYDPVMPAHATDPSHALRLGARMGREG